jgi:hypothetical protein
MVEVRVRVRVTDAILHQARQLAPELSLRNAVNHGGLRVLQ